VVQHRAKFSAGPALVAACLAGVALIGCPQLLDDDFGITLREPEEEPSTLDPDASVATAGAAGAGGHGGASAAAAGTGGATTGAGGASSPPPPSELGALLAHRYRFDTAGSSVVDSVGSAHGTTAGAVQSNGKLTLSGSNHVDLPNGIISSLQSVTFEAWVTWSANPALTTSNWQILFSFGTNARGEGLQGSGTTYLALTPKASNSGHIRASYTLTGYDNEVYADADRYLPATAGTQVVMVIDGARGSITVYVDGSSVATQTGLTLDLAAIRDVNNWIGRSQFSEDPNFVGDVLDFRIYGSALSAAQVALSHGLGADAEL
jgi:large repetitive protein